MIELLSYPTEFKDLLKKIEKKCSKISLMESDGIGSQIDINEYSKKFFGKIKATADISVDANANIEQVTLLQYHSEMTKPIHRLNTLYLFWKYAKELYNSEFANLLVEKQLDKTIYINDAGNLVAYCFNFSCMDIVCGGLPFTTKAKSAPPKNIASFKGQVTNFITTSGNNIAGACGVADFLICLSWYVEKLRNENKGVPKEYLDKQIKQEIQGFIYDVNQPFRGGIQSFFTNVSIYDSVFLEKLCAEYIFPDGKTVSVDTVKELQEIYVDLMNETLESSPVTFPVTTACFAVDDNKNILDRDFLKFVSEKNKKFGFLNIYAGETSTLSSCCFDKKQTVTTKRGTFTFEELEKLIEADNPTGEYSEYVLHKGNWSKGKLIKVPKGTKRMFEITPEYTLDHTAAFYVTEDHIHLTDSGLKTTLELTVNDKLATFDKGMVYFTEIGVINEYQSKDEFVYCFEMEDQNDPYFTLPNGIITHNCRLRSSKENLGYANSFGAGSNKIGSIGVCTINLPRLAFRAKSEEDFLDKVHYYTEFASKVNHVKRYIIKKRIASGHYPLYSLGFMDLKKQYSTCGIIGVNEACEILKKPILTEQGQTLTLDTLDIINKVNAIQEKKYKTPHNCEQIPGETVAVKLAEIDRALGYNDKYDIYSNQFIPLTTEADMYDRIKLQGIFDSSMSGGAICHINIADEIPDAKYIEKLIEHAISQGVVYFAINYNLQSCEDNHLHVGKSDKCKVCGKDIVNNYTRVVGFLVATKNWNPTRRKIDYPNRQWHNAKELKKCE